MTTASTSSAATTPSRTSLPGSRGYGTGHQVSGAPGVSRRTVPRWVQGVGVAGTVGIGAGAFWLSFTALTRLASMAGVPDWQAWAWPLIVDGLIVVATIAVVTLSGRRQAWYPWLLLIAAALVSVTGNAVHATLPDNTSMPGPLAAVIAAVPPIVLLAVTHLTAILTRSRPSPGTGGSPSLAAQRVAGGETDAGPLPAAPPSNRTDHSTRPVEAPATTVHATLPMPPDASGTPTPPPPGREATREFVHSYGGGDVVSPLPPTIPPSLVANQVAGDGDEERTPPPEPGTVPTGATAEVSAHRFLLDYLAQAGGSVPAAEVIAAAARSGITATRMKDARRRAAHPAVSSHRDTDGGWTWTTSPSTDPATDQEDA